MEVIYFELIIDEFLDSGYEDKIDDTHLIMYIWINEERRFTRPIFLLKNNNNYKFKYPYSSSIFPNNLHFILCVNNSHINLCFCFK